MARAASEPPASPFGASGAPDSPDAGEPGWPTVNAWRKATRAELRERRLALPPRERRALNERVRGHLTAALAGDSLGALPLGFYWPFRGEVDLLRLMKAHVAAGGSAALPVVVQRNAPVEWWAWTPDTPLEPGIWKIPVPARRDPVEPALLLVPLLGFDGAGYRLGNGGGYYDRSLAALEPPPATLGVGYELGRLASIRPQPHDVPLDAVVTETGLHWPRDAAAESTAGSSPVCYAEEAAPDYFGYLSAAEASALLRACLAATGRALRDARAIDAQRRLARAALLLRGLLAATPHDGTPPPDLPPSLAEAVQQARAALPRVAPEPLHAGLAAWLALVDPSAPPGH